MKTWLADNRKRITEGLFYLALTTELLLMILEKSEISFHQESHVFRVTFVLTLLAVLFMEHSKKGMDLYRCYLGIYFSVLLSVRQE